MKPHLEMASIVMLGSFNPAIFQPSWLAQKNLIALSDAQTAEVRLISPQLSSFKAGGILIEVLQERFSAQVDEAQDQLRVRDLVSGVFAVLGETPIGRMGLNWTYVFRLKDRDQWHAVGDKLAPKEDVWFKVLRGRPGLLSMTVQGELPAGLSGFVNVKVEPTPLASNAVRIDVNNDVTGLDRDGPFAADTFVEVIRTRWEEIRKESAEMASKFLHLAAGDA